MPRWARSSELKENSLLCFFGSVCVRYMWVKLTSDIRSKKGWGTGECDRGGKERENMLIKTVTSVNLHFSVTV